MGVPDRGTLSGIKLKPISFLRTSRRCFYYQGVNHISDHDLERFHLGMVKDEAELAMIEEHLLICSDCIDAAEQAAQYVDELRAAIIKRSLVLNCDL